MELSKARLAGAAFTAAVLFAMAFLAPEARAKRQPLDFPPVDQAHAGEPRGYDSEPSAVELPDGTFWVAWHAFAEGGERIAARPFRGDEEGPAIEVSPGPGVYGHPAVAAARDGTVWVLWPAEEAGRWALWARQIEADRAGPAYRISPEETDAPLPAATLPARSGGLRVAWTSFSGERFGILTREWRQGAWSEIESVSQPDADAFRPSLAEDGQGNTWVFWDGYASGESGIFGRIVAPAAGPIERLSEPGDRHFRPVAAFGGSAGLAVAWVKAVDVIGGMGVIDQWHTMRMAVRVGERWELARDVAGNPEAVEITQGLLARMEPAPQPAGGFSGRRRHPMLLEDRGSLWLVWERKSGPGDAAPPLGGDLIGRRFNGDHWEEPRVFLQGYVDYRLAAEAQVRDGSFTVLASEMPRGGRRAYHRFEQGLETYAAFEQEEWRGWRPVNLRQQPRRPRFEVREGDRTFTLFWMDSHVHSRLSPDAEGEPDEILFYARDRARLDAVVMQENDFNLVPLTEYAYRLGKFFGRAISGPGFLALPGFEWTGQGAEDDKPAAARSDAARNRRTVIYPSSGGPLVRSANAGSDIKRLHDTVAGHGGVVHTQRGEFNLSGHPVEVGVETAAGWQTYFRTTTHIHSILDKGHRIGFLATSASHRRNPGLNGGLTGILAEELTSEAILEAYRERRFFATNGARVALEARANGVLMGRETVAASGPVELTLRIDAPRPIVRASLVRNGSTIMRFAGWDRTGLSVRYHDPDLEPGDTWYYWLVELEDGSPQYDGNVAVAEGNLAWSTPNWVRVP